MRKLILIAAVLAVGSPLAAGSASASSHHAQMAADPALGPILADGRRDADRVRDTWRHPAEALAFFQVKPGMTVVDYMPSGGWWTRILVPYLGEQGHYIGLNPDVRTSTAAMQENFGNMAATFPSRASGWTGVPAERIAAFNSDVLPAELDGKADRVLIFREMHNLWRLNLMHRELTTVRRLLKDDGLLGIVQHRARADAPASYTDGHKGYLREKDVIALIEAHGFELVARSEINANPRDTADHPGGVWMLPPVSRGVPDADKVRYSAIGESDRMTLLFRKRP